EARKKAIIEQALTANGKVVEEKKTVLADQAPKAKKTARAGKKNAAKSKTKTYKIKKGDTLWHLAKRFGISTVDLRKANNLGARPTLRIGQSLTIPVN
ncbi:MAG: LysM peptidoglycan-binding domain-containing protein, partial [Thermodesulfobacteriota bacterium]